MRVVTSSYGTFHMYNQALQLNRHGLLSRFITGPPVYFAKQYGIPSDKVSSLWPIFAGGYLRNQISSLVPDTFNNQLIRLTHDLFSRNLAKRIPYDTNIFIGLSSFCMSGIEAANEHGIITVVDHGSLHQLFEKQQLILEQDRFGYKLTGNSLHDWLIEKEGREFDAARYVIVMSELSRQTLIENGVRADKVLVNRCGISLSMYIQKPRQDNVFRIAFCGQVCPLKGIHYLLEAFDAFKHLEVELWVIGSLDHIKGDPHFYKLLRLYDLPNIRFFGAVDSSSLPGIFSQCSVFVHPSLADGYGMVVLQAMACGLPVIVTNTTGASEIVREGDNGFVVPSRNVEALVDRISFFLREPTRTRELGHAAKESIQEGQTWDDYGDRLAGLLNDMKFPLSLAKN